MNAAESSAKKTRSRLSMSLPLLALGYFVFYAPYAGLTKGLTSGLLPDSDGPVSGFVILPATVVATIVTMAVILVATGWWRTMETREVFGISVPVPRLGTLLSGLADATIIGTTTMAYTFENVSIVLMMLLMRGGVLLMSPFMDRLYHLRIRWFSWLALFLSLAALSLALTSEQGAALSLAAAINVAGYLTGYALRFWNMGRLGKSHDREANLRYFAEEQMVATPTLLLALGVVAVVGQGPASAELAAGFTTFWASDEIVPALIVGALYGLLCVFGTLIYLDHSENTYAVPVNRSSSLLAGASASFVLALMFGGKLPAPIQLLGAALLISAAVVLAVGPRLAHGRTAERLILFVCSGNTCRSAMAERLAMLEASRRLNMSIAEIEASGLRFASAGVSAKPGTQMDEVAVEALGGVGAPDGDHRSQLATPELIARAEVVICLSPEERDRVIQIAPWAIARTHLIDAAGRPVDKPSDGNYERFAAELLAMVRESFDRLEIVLAGG